jgi:hypothetical protein
MTEQRFIILGCRVWYVIGSVVNLFRTDRTMAPVGAVKRSNRPYEIRPFTLWKSYVPARIRSAVEGRQTFIDVHRGRQRRVCPERVGTVDDEAGSF